ncbi:MAG: hypothetical protein DI598_11675 [Pseudopedobacter saltans]|uniref:Bifunctional 4-hydroxy-2-oxoglutarate aldolase/2-dehydro-3-deoxy-phosphogluconate aldolase n=1 Tax=Pseudopedobacter saltans TaxID=151895 RepID=A0A2W5EZ74_9SPHI|nr:MAG: hypothetical protein DI598_11675 [Pseudopedobacter saltans]
MNMNDHSTIKGLIQDQGFLPLYFYKNKETNKKILDLVYSKGVRIIEFALRGEGMLEVLRDLIAYKNEKYPDFYIGVGTVKSPEDVLEVAQLDIAFISSPGMDPAIGKVAEENNAIWMPGCMTITEIMMAERHGAKVVKLCPAALLTSSFLVGVKDIFPNLTFIPMGGIEPHKNEIGPWFDAGAIAVSIGSRLLGKTLLDNEAYDVIETRLIQLISMINSMKKYKLEEAKELELLHKKASNV